MTITLLLAEAVARDLRSDGFESPEARKVLDVIRRFDGSLAPMHPGADDDTLSKWFTVEVSESSDDRRLAEALQSLEAVEAAYVKPPDALP